MTMPAEFVLVETFVKPSRTLATSARPDAPVLDLPSRRRSGRRVVHAIASWFAPVERRRPSVKIVPGT